MLKFTAEELTDKEKSENQGGNWKIIFCEVFNFKIGADSHLPKWLYFYGGFRNWTVESVTEPIFFTF